MRFKFDPFAKRQINKSKTHFIEKKKKKLHLFAPHFILPGNRCCTTSTRNLTKNFHLKLFKICPKINWIETFVYEFLIKTLCFKKKIFSCKMRSREYPEGI